MDRVMKSLPRVNVEEQRPLSTLATSSRRTVFAMLACSLLVFFTSSSDGQAADASPSISNKQTATRDEALQKRWKEQTQIEAANVARKHIHGLVRAAHLYHEAHGEFPPAVVPNTKLPAGKRLSGLVLLLPYLHAESGIEKGEPCFDAKVVRLAKELHRSIDLTKAWDDPVNLKAAKTVVPAFIAPQNGIFRNRQGFAVCHFAMVQGSTPFFMVFSPKTNPLLDQISTRAGGELINNFEVTRVRNPFER
jgi:hypothetical protein